MMRFTAQAVQVKNWTKLWVRPPGAKLASRTYLFDTTGNARFACKVQDDMVGEGLWTNEIDVK